MCAMIFEGEPKIGMVKTCLQAMLRSLDEHADPFGDHDARFDDSLDDAYLASRAILAICDHPLTLDGVSGAKALKDAAPKAIARSIRAPYNCLIRRSWLSHFTMDA